MKHMEKEKLITVAVALYNGEQYIKRCLESILAQTYPFIEIIVIDDGSTDSGVKIIEAMNADIKIYHKKNGGLGSARNESIKYAQGEFILCIDADDWLENNAVEMLVKTQKEHNCDIVKMNYYINKIEKKTYATR